MSGAAEGRLRERIDRIFALSPKVRYVAISAGGILVSRERPDLAAPSSSESDRYEELIVNPVLLELVTRRGNIDCGGVRFVVVRYGNFFQAIVPFAGGHVSAALDPDADPPSIVPRIREIAARWKDA